jgi:hypothetical protein
VSLREPPARADEGLASLPREEFARLNEALLPLREEFARSNEALVALPIPELSGSTHERVQMT